MPAPYATHRAQIKAILLAWGMPEENAEPTADILSWADLHGVDSHGMSMLPGYDRMRRNGRAKMDARPKIVKETPISALVDGGGGLGHVPAHFAMQVAIDKAKASGMAIAAVRNSAHFGATGYYTLMAAKQGLIGMACTSASSIQVAPTFGKEAKLGTDPWSFAAPSGDERPFLLDMATTTVAAGRIRNKANEGLRVPARLGAEQGRAAEHRSAGGAGEGRVPDLARRVAGEFQLQGLRAGGDGEHPGVVPVGGDADHRPAAHEEAAGHGHRPLLHGDRSGTVPRRPTSSRATSRGSAAICARRSRSIRRSR